MQKPSNVMVVFVIVFTGFIGLSLPYPVFSHLFLATDSVFLPLETSEQTRTIYLGVAIALFPLGQAIGSPILGTCSDRFGRKPVLMFSLLIATAGMLLVAVAIYLNMLPLLLFGRLISGLGEGNIAVAQAVVSGEGDENRKAKNFALISIAMNAGWIVGPLLGGVLGDREISAYANPMLPFFLAAAMYFSIIPIVYGFLQDKSTGEPVAGGEIGFLPMLFNNRGIFGWVLLLTLFCFFGTYVMFSFFAPYLVQVFAVSSSALGVYSALLSVPLIIAGIYSDRVNTFMGTMNMTVLSIILMSVGLVLFPIPDELVWLIVPCVVVAAGIVFLEVATAILVSEVTPKEQQGKAMGIYRSTIVFAEIVAGIIGGWLAGVQPHMPHIVAAAVVLLGLPLLVVGRQSYVQVRQSI